MYADEYIDKIYQAISPAILAGIPGIERTGVSVAYRKYLIDTYGAFLREIEEKPEKGEDALRLLENKEKSRWENLTADQKKARLLPDHKLEDLRYLSELALQAAYKCIQTGEYKTSQEDYERELFQISECLEGIAPYHLDYAKELLSETLLDVDYAYGKSKNKSFRLARRCGKGV